MRRFRFSALIVLFGILVPTVGCQAQVQIENADEQIAGAVLPAPEEARDSVMVYGYDVEGNLVPLREGTNDLICLADQPGDETFHAACYHVSLEPYMARGRELRAEGIDRQESFRIRHEEADAGTLEMPSAPAAVYNLSAPLAEFDPATVTVGLYALYIPHATTATTGLPERPSGPGAPWIMRPDTPSAHIMIVPPRN